MHQNRTWELIQSPKQIFLPGHRSTAYLHYYNSKEAKNPPPRRIFCFRHILVFYKLGKNCINSHRPTQPQSTRTLTGITGSVGDVHKNILLPSGWVVYGVLFTLDTSLNTISGNIRTTPDKGIVTINA